METAGKSSLLGGSHSLEVLASQNSQCSSTHSPILWFGALNNSCPYLSLSSDSGGVEGSSSSSSSFPAVISLLKKYSQSSVLLCCKNVGAISSFTGGQCLPGETATECSQLQREWEVKYWPQWIKFHPSPMWRELCYHEGGTAWSRGNICRNKISIGKKV